MQQPQDYVSLKNYTSNVAVGGAGGNPYSLFATWNYVHQATFYRDSGRMRAIEIKRFGGSSIKLGGSFTDDPQPVTFTLECDELVTRILLYSTSYGGGRFAGLRINTTKQTLEAFAKGYTPCEADQVEIPVGTGKWTGVFGKAGNDIDSFGIGMDKQC